MPSFVITNSQHRQIGKAIDAILCAPGPSGYPNERSAVPVKATISERTLRIDEEPRPRSIISCIAINGMFIYLVDGSTKAVRNAEHCAALAKAQAVLRQLIALLRLLREASEEPELAAEGVGLLANWFAEERERLTAGTK